MARLANMLERLPPTFTIDRGSLVEQLLALVSLQLALYDEDLDFVQRSHWVLHASRRDDLVKLGALFELPAAAWESDEMYRARLVATIRGRLQGAVTRADLELVLRTILASAQISLGLRYADIGPQTAGERAFFATGPLAQAERPAFTEFPLVLRRSPQLAHRNGVVRPLEHFEAHNRGIDECALELALTGAQRSRTTMPVIVNSTTGELIAFAGLVPCGQMLRISAGPERALSATLDGVDVTSRVYTANGFEPGPGFKPLLPDPAPRSLRLARGVNDLWIFSLALYDHPSFDRAAFAMPTPTLRQGEFNDAASSEPPSRFDDALFHQEPIGTLDVFWREKQAASFRFDVPACAVLRPRELGAAADELHAQLFDLLQSTIDMLRGAAVLGVVRARPFESLQRSNDRCRVASAHLPPESASAGVDLLAALGCLFDVTALDRSRFA